VELLLYIYVYAYLGYITYFVHQPLGLMSLTYMFTQKILLVNVTIFSTAHCLQTYTIKILQTSYLECGTNGKGSMK